MVVDCIELETELPECSQYASIKCLPNSAFFQTIFDGSWTILRFCHVHRKAKIGQKLKSAPSHQEPRTSQSSFGRPWPEHVFHHSSCWVPSSPAIFHHGSSIPPNGAPPLALGASYAYVLLQPVHVGRIADGRRRLPRSHFRAWPSCRGQG